MDNLQLKEARVNSPQWITYKYCLDIHNIYMKLEASVKPGFCESRLFSSFKISLQGIPRYTFPLLPISTLHAEVSSRTD